jgi:hypothetical protein
MAQAERERLKSEAVEAKRARSEKRAQKLLKSAQKAYKLAEEAHARAKALQDAASGPHATESDVTLANEAAKDANEAQQKWDAAYALAKDAMDALEEKQH